MLASVKSWILGRWKGICARIFLGRSTRFHFSSLQNRNQCWAWWLVTAEASKTSCLLVVYDVLRRCDSWSPQPKIPPDWVWRKKMLVGHTMWYMMFLLFWRSTSSNFSLLLQNFATALPKNFYERSSHDIKLIIFQGKWSGKGDRNGWPWHEAGWALILGGFAWNTILGPAPFYVRKDIDFGAVNIIFWKHLFAI